jgi:hypothetical protein
MRMRGGLPSTPSKLRPLVHGTILSSVTLSGIYLKVFISLL